MTQLDKTRQYKTNTLSGDCTFGLFKCVTFLNLWHSTNLLSIEYCVWTSNTGHMPSCAGPIGNLHNHSPTISYQQWKLGMWKMPLNDMEPFVANFSTAIEVNIGKSMKESPYMKEEMLQVFSIYNMVSTGVTNSLEPVFGAKLFPNGHKSHVFFFFFCRTQEVPAYMRLFVFLSHNPLLITHNPLLIVT